MFAVAIAFAAALFANPSSVKSIVCAEFCAPDLALGALFGGLDRPLDFLVDADLASAVVNADTAVTSSRSKNSFT